MGVEMSNFVWFIYVLTDIEFFFFSILRVSNYTDWIEENMDIPWAVTFLKWSNIY